MPKLYQYIFSARTLNLGNKVRRTTNPFTNEDVEYVVDRGLTSSEIAALQTVFRKNGVAGPEPHSEGYAVYGSGTRVLRFRCRDLETTTPKAPLSGMEIELTCVSLHPPDNALSVILEVARAGNLCLVEGESARVFDELPTAEQLRRWPAARMIKSTAELLEWLIQVVRPREVLEYMPPFDSR